MDNNKQNKKDSIIAACVTFGVALIVLLILFFGTIGYDSRDLAAASTPEISLDEELIEPEILQELGEENATADDEPAPAYKGEPEPAPEENTVQTTPGKNPEPAPPVEKKVTQTKESPVKATEPTVSEEEKKKVTSMKGKFSSNNGATSGTSGSSGAGGAGVGKSGSADGRSFIDCPTPQVSVPRAVTVVVSVVINAEGTVTKANVKSGSSASDDVKRRCEQAALRAKWSKKKDAPLTKGTITFRITPRK